MINIVIRFENEQIARAVKVIEILHDHFFGLKLDVIRNGDLMPGDQFVDRYYRGGL